MRSFKNHWIILFGIACAYAMFTLAWYDPEGFGVFTYVFLNAPILIFGFPLLYIEQFLPGGYDSTGKMILMLSAAILSDFLMLLLFYKGLKKERMFMFEKVLYGAVITCNVLFFWFLLSFS